MDTQLFFEELKGQLGDAAARSLTRTFAAVCEELRDGVTRGDFRILRESMDENVSRLDRSLTRLADAQARTEANVSRLDTVMARLADAQTEMTTALQRLTIRTDSVVGRTRELQFRDRIASYPGLFMRRCRPATPAPL
jgi:predicted Rossmann fold nucleotide-binding protein DprA/Smf involved in DNA uptake